MGKGQPRSVLFELWVFLGHDLGIVRLVLWQALFVNVEGKLT